MWSRVRKDYSLSPTLFNIYINELALQLEQSAAPGLTLHDEEIKFLLYADDLVLLSPTEQGLGYSRAYHAESNSVRPGH